MRPSRAHRVLTCVAVTALAACGSEPAGCNPTEPGCGPAPAVSTIVVAAPIDTVMAVGRTAQLSASATDASGSPVTVSFAWSSASTSVATVSDVGLVSADGVGSTSIEARAEGVVGTWPLRVVDADLDGISALLADPFAGALIGSLDTATASDMDQLVAVCGSAVTDGDVLRVRGCLQDAIAAESPDPANDPALAVLDLMYQESLRKLRLDG